MTVLPRRPRLTPRRSHGQPRATRRDPNCAPAGLRTRADEQVERDTRAELFDERRDVTVPIAMLALVGAAVAIAFGFSANQDNGTSSTAKATAATAAAAAPDATVAPDATPGSFDKVATRFDPKTAPVAPGAKTFDLTTEEVKVKVGDKVYDEWTFNGTVPGPVLRAVVGDRITVRIHNSSASKMLHSVDFHASRMSMGGGDVQVAPGKTGSFTFTAEYPGVFMYHCATAPVLDHISHGMYGMLIVQPKEGFGPKMPEYAVVQSELYTNFDAASKHQHTAVVFNGQPKQYADAPIALPANTNVRLFFLNAGPSELSSFHVVGTVFDKAYDDGNPANVSYGRQALAVPASGGEVLEMQLVGEGMFPFVTHQFDHVNSGAVGMFKTGDGARIGKPAPAAGHPAH